MWCWRAIGGPLASGGLVWGVQVHWSLLSKIFHAIQRYVPTKGHFTHEPREPCDRELVTKESVPRPPSSSQDAFSKHGVWCGVVTDPRA